MLTLFLARKLAGSFGCSPLIIMVAVQKSSLCLAKSIHWEKHLVAEIAK